MRRHDSDIVSLVAGLLFLSFAGAWALNLIDLLPRTRGWLLPLVLVVAGAAGLLSARQRRPAADSPDTTFDSEAPEL